MRLLFINSLSSLRKKKLQIIGIILLVFLSTSIYTMMSLAVDRMDNGYVKYKKEQNVEDMSLGVNIDYKNSYTYSDILNIKGTVDFNEDEQFNINLYLMCHTYRNCTDDFLKKIDLIFEKYGLNQEKKESILKEISRKYRFDFEPTYSKIVQDDIYLYRVMPYNKDKKINKPYLLKGSFPNNNGEITVLDGFARKNNLKINDNLKLGDKEYKITGYAYASDYMFPIISITSPMFNEKTNNIIFMTEADYKVFLGVEEISNSVKFRNENKEEEIFKKESRVSRGINNIIRKIRIEMPESEFKNDRVFAESFLYLLLGVSTIIILLIAKKRIEDERLQIGVLKALGYSKVKIALSYLVYPIIGGLLGGLLGFGFGYLMHPYITDLFISYFNIPVLPVNMDFNYLLRSVLVPTLLLTLLTFLIFIFMLRHKALFLLREGSNIKVNFISRFVTRITSFLPFKGRLRISLANRSIGKLFIVSISAFLTGLLIVLILISSDLFNYMIGKTFDGLNYDYIVSYNKPIETVNLVDDLVFSSDLEISKVFDKSDNVKELKKINKDVDLAITVEGIDSELHYITLKNEDNKVINSNLKESKIVISTNISAFFGIKLGDKIIFKGLDKKYIVTDIVESYSGFTAYVDREELTKSLNTKLSYNKIYSKNSIYSKYSNIDPKEIQNISSIFSIKDLKDNMEMAMETYDVSLYVVIVFAGLMVFIIVLVIANIVIEENKKTISLMKVLGYKDKEINSIVLNMYTPFIIISYLISIPVMIAILKKIVEILAKNVDFTIPITLSIEKALLGLVVLLIGYYVAMFISKRSLKKIPLAVSLKRE